jgi:energy-coupling factor transport system permease protein
MLRDITIGQYYPTNSIIHNLDPRTKLIATIAFVTSLFAVSSLATYAIVVIGVYLASRASRVPISYMTRGLKSVVMIVVFAFVLNIFMTKGSVLFAIGPLVATREGLHLAFLMGFRLIILIVGTSLLTLTTTPLELSDGIERGLKPLDRIGVKSHDFAMMMTIAIRFIPTLLEETDKIMKAQMARGADFETGSISQRARSLVPVLVPLFISAFRRATDLAMAMEARCYRGGDNRTKLKVLKYGKIDAYAIIAIVAYVACVVAGDIILRRII